MKIIAIFFVLVSYVEASKLIDEPTNCKTQEECNLVSKIDAQMASEL